MCVYLYVDILYSLENKTNLSTIHEHKQLSVNTRVLGVYIIRTIVQQ